MFPTSSTVWTAELQAYNDPDTAANTTIPEADAIRLGFNFWEKRTMTNDFATVVHRMRSLGKC